MLTFDEAYDALDEIAEKLPPEVLTNLNGGIIMLPEEKLHPKSKANDLYILGQYHFDPKGLGRYITLNYGSFCLVYSHMSDEDFVKQLEKTLHHELVHHLEHMAGDNDLDIADATHLAEYLGDL